MEQETQIYFLRHGQTNNNKEGRMQGRVDIPLNEVGRAQAPVPAAAEGHWVRCRVFQPAEPRGGNHTNCDGPAVQEINIEPRY